MKLLFIAILSSSLWASVDFAGKVYDFDEKAVGNCSIEVDIQTLEKSDIEIKSFKFFDQEIKSISLRYFMENGIDGLLYLLKKDDRRRGLIFNTDSNARPYEMSFHHNREPYKCRFM